jgi:hypothetical protein
VHYKFDLVMLNLMALPYAGNTLSVTTQIYLYKWIKDIGNQNFYYLYLLGIYTYGIFNFIFWPVCRV